MNEDAIVNDYYRIVCELVREKTGANKVIAFDHNIRSSDTSSWMNKDGITNPSKKIEGGNKILSPAQVVHNDYTLIISAPNRLDLLSESAKANDTWGKTHGTTPLVDPSELDSLKCNRYMFVNVWRSISDHPVKDMPLGLCDGSTIKSDDLVTFEIRHADRIGENYLSRFLRLTNGSISQK